VRTVDIEIRNPSGIHLRPASTLVRAAAGYRCAVTLQNLTSDGSVVNAKDALAVLSRGKAVKGDLVRIATDGEDEDAAIEGLRDLIASGLGETIG
jgi:phosphotransferase system HPr (HPr) family protein